MFQKGRAWVSDPAEARSENVALPVIIRVVRVIRCKKSVSGNYYCSSIARHLAYERGGGFPVAEIGRL